MRSLLKAKAWLMSLMTIAVLLSCQQSFIEPCNLLIEEEEAATQEASATEESKDIVPAEDIPWPIAGAKVKQFIEAIPPGEALLVMIRPEYFRKRGIQFPVVFHEHSGQEFMFALEDVLEDAAKYLQDYYSKCPSSHKMQLVPVADPTDLRQIAWKTSPGAAGSKNLNIQRDYLGEEEKGVEKFFNLKDAPYPWTRLCSQGLMRYALRVTPTQEQSKPHDGWCCGVTSAAKAINMLPGVSMDEAYYRDSFLPNAPRIFTKKGAEETGGKMGAIGGALACLAFGLLL